MKSDITTRKKSVHLPTGSSCRAEPARDADTVDIGLTKHDKSVYSNNRSGLLLGATLGAFIGSLATFFVSRQTGIEPGGFFAIVAMLLGALLGVLGDLIAVSIKERSG